jgi:hypothetical protein
MCPQMYHLLGRTSISPISAQQHLGSKQSDEKAYFPLTLYLFWIFSVPMTLQTITRVNTTVLENM